MTQTPSSITMPAKPQLVAEAVARLDVLGLRSGLMELDTRTLTDLGMQLTDRKVTVRDAGKWLNKELGGTDDEPVVPERNVYRYAENFRKVYGQVRSEHARRVARLSVENATEGNVATMAKVATQRLVDLVAEKLTETDNLEELSATELSAAISTLDGLNKHKIKEAELALKTAEGERKAARLEADLAKMQAQLQQLQAENEAREAARRKAADTARQTLDTVSGKSGGTVTRQQVLEILDAVMKGDA